MCIFKILACIKYLPIRNKRGGYRRLIFKCRARELNALRLKHALDIVRYAFYGRKILTQFPPPRIPKVRKDKPRPLSTFFIFLFNKIHFSPEQFTILAARY